MSKQQVCVWHRDEVSMKLSSVTQTRNGSNTNSVPIQKLISVKYVDMFEIAYLIRVLSLLYFGWDMRVDEMGVYHVYWRIV